MFQTYSPIEYLCIDIANNFGLDKELFETRIQWVKDNFNKLEDLTDQVEEDKFLYIKSVMALRDVVAGKATGHLISLDATCSGMQLLSALTGCLRGAEITNLTPINKRFDAYTEVNQTQNEYLNTWGIQTAEASRSECKQAVMTSLYGSQAKPKEIFGEDSPQLKAFYEACFTKAPGAFQTLTVLKKAWQSMALSHYWKMPDGFDCALRVVESEETRIEIDELNHHKFTTSYKQNVGTKTGISLPANVTHSTDAYLLRTLLRRCSYNPKAMNKALGLLKDNLEAPVVNNCDQVASMMALAKSTRIVDTSWFDLITADNVTSIPKAMKMALIQQGERIVANPSFPVLTVHDAFRCSPANGDTVRYWYKEILAEIAESDLLNHMLTMITGRKSKLPKLSNQLPQLIRDSSYALC